MCVQLSNPRDCKAPAAVKTSLHEILLSFWDKNYQTRIYGPVSRDVKPLSLGAELFLQSHFKTL